MVKKTRDDVANHKSKMIKNFNKFLDDLISEENEKSFLKADKISYWLEDWMNYLKLEESFECRKIPKLKRGSVVKVHLGFNIGNEEGGLHYAIVLDNNNALGHSLITIVPLTSVKPKTNLKNLYDNQLFIGNELYWSLINKATVMLNKLESLMNQEGISANDHLKIKKELDYTKRVINEINKMKKGSIILMGQITTISKMRIYDPKNKFDVLNGVRVSNDVLDKIDNKLHDFYLKKIKIVDK